MKLKIVLLLLSLINYSSGYCQLKKMFTKTPNLFVEADKIGNLKSAVKNNDAKFEFYFDNQNDSGYIMVTERDGSQWKMKIKEMYTGIAKGLKIYYFRSLDGGFKISTSAEENGLAIYSYKEKILTIFYSQ